MTSIESLTAAAENLGVSVQFADFSGLRGVYSAELKTIFINTRYPYEHQRYALAHELGHVVYGHSCSTGKNEYAADRHAVELLISDEDYRDAELEADGNIRGIAAILELPVEVIRFYQSQLLRTDLHTYRCPRHGVGVYKAKHAIDIV